jgi:hypothetical protein
MSFLKKLFGGSDKPAAPAGPAGKAEHEGFTILATPYQEKEIGGEMKSHRFIRADRFASQAEAVEMTLMKARQIIDQSGQKLLA